MYYPNYPPPMRQDGPMMPQPPWQAAMNPPPQQPPNPGFTVRPVTSREDLEALRGKVDGRRPAGKGAAE